MNLNAINEKDALQRLGGDTELFQELLEIYAEDAPIQIKKMTEQYQQADFPALAITAHTLKGSSANVGAESLQQLAFDIEKACHNSDSSRIKSCLQEIEILWADLCPS